VPASSSVPFWACAAYADPPTTYPNTFYDTIILLLLQGMGSFSSPSNVAFVLARVTGVVAVLVDARRWAVGGGGINAWRYIGGRFTHFLQRQT